MEYITGNKIELSTCVSNVWQQNCVFWIIINIGASYAKTYNSNIDMLESLYDGEKLQKLVYCQAQPQLQVKLSLKAELALFSINPATPTPTWESLFSNISQ